ncbi:MAG: S-layer homology domain-containing protein [Candidatus Eremiobacteraeota bacterium]|nr:S-layer homology domain-containing protein [Candidatus Eremiobacteraeota bacterium]
MTGKLAKTYGTALVLIGILLVAIDVLFMSVELKMLTFSLNPLEVAAHYLNRLCFLSFSFAGVISSLFFSLVSVAAGISFFFKLFSYFQMPPEERSPAGLAVTGGISLFAWLIHGACISYYYTIDKWRVEVSTFKRQFFCTELFWITMLLCLFAFLLFVIPTRSQKPLRRALSYGLWCFALLILGNILLFVFINMVLNKEDFGITPVASLIALIFLGAGAAVLIENDRILTLMESIDHSLKLTALAAPLVNFIEKEPEKVAPRPGSDPHAAQAPSKEGRKDDKEAPPPPGPAAAESAPGSSPMVKPEPLAAAEGSLTAPGDSKASPDRPAAMTEKPPAGAAAPPPKTPPKSAAAAGVLWGALSFAFVAAMFLVWFYGFGPGKRAEQAQTPAPTPSVAEVTPTPPPSPSPAASPSVSAEKPSMKIFGLDEIAYTDISESTFRKQITDIARLGVFESISGPFEPDKPITRALYVKWLVKAHNIYFPVESGNFIKLPEVKTSAFEDVPLDHPDWKWIQAMANAGYVIGYDLEHFKPDKELSREEMMAIRCSLEYNITEKDIRRYEENLDIYKKDLEERFNDASKITHRYIAGYYKDMDNAFIVLRSVFGTTRVLMPQEKLTRAEGAASIWAIHGTNAKKTIEKISSGKELVGE